ncbi:putative microtubule-severing ATPase [Dioscorea sansibarensis]
MDEKIYVLFPYNIEIKPPEDDTHLVSWKSRLEEDMKMIKIKDNRNHIMEVLAANDIECDDLGSIHLADTVVLSNYIEEIVVSAVTFHLMNNKNPEYRNGKLIISSNSLSHGLRMFQGKKRAGKMNADNELVKGTESEESLVAMKPEMEVSTYCMKVKLILRNQFPRRRVIRVQIHHQKHQPEVIPSHEIGLTFDDIGALDDIRESLQELVMLPLRTPDLFKGGLLKPCRGILLFGPPGIGKTMLAKAIAKEAGASFINVSMSTITSKWFGEDEKNVRALFTLAAKISPCITFVDEVDSMLGQHSREGEHEAMRKIKNEFMTYWDGLLTKTNERILVLAATN